ncbi:MAG: leucine-rich repeat domain-containing protein [Holosporales bacterium]|jgi:hypothetical protein|nr:leucine-rich repeat domain-containing protein [Holosporales bacterium]
MNKTLLSKIFAAVLCFIYASHQQVVASDYESKDESDSEWYADSYLKPKPEREEDLVCYSARLFSRPYFTRNGNVAGGTFKVVAHEAIEHYYYSHIDTDDALRQDPSSVDVPVEAVSPLRTIRNSFERNWRDYEPVTDFPRAPGPYVLRHPRATCILYRVDIDAPEIYKEDVDAILSDLNAKLEYSGDLPKPDIICKSTGTSYYRSFLNRCIIRIPATARIGAEAFAYNWAIREVRLLPKSKHAAAQPTPSILGKKAFCSCAYLQYVELPHSIGTIGKQAFDCCEYLARVAMDSVTCIDEGTFDYCPNFNTTLLH